MFVRMQMYVCVVCVYVHVFVCAYVNAYVCVRVRGFMSMYVFECLRVRLCLRVGIRNRNSHTTPQP